MKNIFIAELKRTFSSSVRIMINIGGGVLPFLLLFYSFKMSIINSVLCSLLFFLIFFSIHLLINIYISLYKNLLVSKNKEIEDLKIRLSQFYETYGIEDSMMPSELFPYTFIESSVDREIVFKKDTLEFETISYMTIVLKSIIENLNKVPHSINIGNMAYDFGRFLPEIVSCKRDKEGSVSIEPEKNDKTKQNYVITFSPSLEKDEKVEYTIKWSYFKAKFISYEEFYAAKQYGFLTSSREAENFCRIVSIPCEKFRSSVKFPKNYAINISKGYSVKKKKQEISKEIHRIQEKSFFHIRNNLNCTELCLEIIRPITGLSYYISWELLRLEELVKIGFLSEKEKTVIENRISDKITYKKWYDKNATNDITENNIPSC